MSEYNDQPSHDEDTQVAEEDRPHDECQKMIQMQGVTIRSLQNRLFQLEMEIVDLISAGSMPGHDRLHPDPAAVHQADHPHQRTESGEDSWGQPGLDRDPNHRSGLLPTDQDRRHRRVRRHRRL